LKNSPGGKAFRAQLVVAEQRQLYDYWIDVAGTERVPKRCDIQPANIARLLPGISLIDVAHPLGESRIRLAGTRLREAYDREVTGQRVCDLNWGDKRGYWLEAFERTVKGAEPTQGVLQGPMIGKEHLVQYWLRLPLRTNDDTISMILSYDYFVPVSEVRDFARRAS
jgi:hypothetical protein